MVDKLSIKKEKIADIQKALQNADVNQDSKLDFEEWRAELKSWVNFRGPYRTVTVGTFFVAGGEVYYYSYTVLYCAMRAEQEII